MTVEKAKWPDYRDVLLPIIQETQTRNQHAFAKEIDEALTDGSAFLFVGADGFFVLRPFERNNGTLWVTVMFAFNWAGNAIERYQATVEKLSRQIGARGLDLYTKVAGLSLLFERQGFQQISVRDGVQHWEKRL
ncbi:hypothetical protein A1OO_08545 [Enterovibrio norvegicus FF-33]|uniref:hypothetical protein n=1 Tax=Enterovibrio norvegicus TaxID=188144 RepID=UPI0002EC48E8|nr:hypothetical protein [Enterovibrio norvegicus]OEE65847.1 hypothetical protein A1OO_08545 [Enterovibrio norvegicus FF-33]